MIVLKLHCITKVRLDLKNMFQLGCCLSRRPLIPSQLPVAHIVFIANPLHVFVYFAQRNKPVLLWREEIFPHKDTIFLAVSERNRLLTFIKKGLRGAHA